MLLRKVVESERMSRSGRWRERCLTDQDLDFSGNDKGQSVKERLKEDRVEQKGHEAWR